ncbi:hypothetical protein C8R45DRAFT_1142987 [Mycena sanguinolenta]|nr:hypothetical protein C8R45DRAFT_1142987 [Mycena sanguinolenta]
MTDSASVTSLSSSAIEREDRANAAPAHDNETCTLLESATRLLTMTHQAPKQTWRIATRTTRISAFILHLVLITTHVLLVVTWARGLEHRITVALEHQKLVSYLITTTTTTFGTIFAAVLVFVTQTLATRSSLQKDQMLTVTHDTAAAWAGIGSAISLLWNQTRIPSPASAMVLLSVIAYLAAILGLHITSSSLFSLVTFNSTRTYRMPTKGLPAFKGNYSDPSSHMLEILNTDANLGLHEGTLYDLLDIPSSISGNATVQATGFNMTCGFLATPSPLIFTHDKSIGVITDSNGGWVSPDKSFSISSTQVGMISTATVFGQLEDFRVIFYSTIPILDSSGELGQLVELSPPMNTTVSSIQLFQCSLSLVAQVAIVDDQTNQLITLVPDFTKTGSEWVPHPAVPEADSASISLLPNVTANVLIDLWELWYQSIPVSSFSLDYSNPDTLASVADIYLIQKLNLPAANFSETQNITLHDFENALSRAVASMFWTTPPYITHNVINEARNGTSPMPLNQIPAAPTLVPGSASVTEVYTAAQLELSIIAISAGLLVSLLLMAVALPLLSGSNHDADIPIDGTGILHAIWLFRNHPELQSLLEQVGHPTDENLRVAGMVQLRLVGDGVSNEEKCHGV